MSLLFVVVVVCLLFCFLVVFLFWVVMKPRRASLQLKQCSGGVGTSHSTSRLFHAQHVRHVGFILLRHSVFTMRAHSSMENHTNHRLVPHYE